MPSKKYSALALVLIVFFLLIIPICFVIWLFGSTPIASTEPLELSQDISLIRSLSFISLAIGLLAGLLYLVHKK